MASNRYYITDKDKITKNEANLVDLTLASGESFTALEPKKLFPVSRSDTYITLLDESRSEIALIKSLDDLEEESHKVIASSLDSYYLIPVIEKIIAIYQIKNSSKYRWSVITNIGPREFEIKDRNSNIVVYPDFSIRLRDSNDIRYIIPDYRKLDSHSLAKIMNDL